MRGWNLIGNPENRRVRGFVAALESCGRPPPTVLSWEELLADPSRLQHLPDDAYLRLESSGENPQVHRGLLALGGRPDVVPRHGELVAPMAAHRGFERVLGWIDEELGRRPSWIPLATPTAILGVFDKADFHRRAEAAGVRVAEGVQVRTVDELFSSLADVPRTVFVKHRVGSSASGLVMLVPGPPMRAMTTVRMGRDGWFNSLRVNRVTDPERIRRLLTWLLEEEGAHVEVAAPKARLDGAFFDCRVLMIDREPDFVVVRQSSHPITNLHLGGRRGSVEALMQACPPATWQAAMEDCRRVARDYGGLHLGIDVLFERGFASHRILEANAFGDLLPRLLKNGRSVYETEILAADVWNPHTH